MSANSPSSIINSPLSILHSPLIPPGYKQTEVGVIPEDWEVKKLPDISWFQEGPGLRQWQFTSSGIKVINVTNLEGGVLNLERTDRYISISEFKRMYQHFKIDTTDILMASSGNSYSKTAVARKQDLPLVMNTSVIRFKPTEACAYSFLWVLLTSPLFKNQIDVMITGGAQPNFGPYHLNRVSVPLPPPSEQRAIASALSDADALIESLEQLIAKKRGIKQATMQALLTPPAAKEMENGKLKMENGNSSHSQLSIINSQLTTRLPGFSGKWEVKKIGDALRICHGRSQHDVEDPNGEYPILGTGGCIGSSRSYIYNKPSVLIGRKGTINKPKYMDSPFWSVDTLFYSIVSESSNPKFMFYKMCMIDWMQYNEASGVPSLNAHTIEAIEIPIPPLPEQIAIAEVLSDMDAGIEALGEKLTKTRLVKQGMMQELLTGKIRLI